MSLVNVSNITVNNNPAAFTAPFSFDITFECISPIEEDLEFKIIYVGSANNAQCDQELESVLVGPVPVGINRFTMEAPTPNLDLIPHDDLLGVTVILLTCSYKGNDFIRVGYYVNNEYLDEELQENPPNVPIVDKLTRNILAEKPRVTRIPIDWDKPSSVPNVGESDIPKQSHTSMAMEMMNDAGVLSVSPNQENATQISSAYEEKPFSSSVSDLNMSGSIY